ncbi:MAG: hypothetical protein E6Z52_00025 [Staphylococcus sp.]|nr:hypothetical protein [Staphylococcus sp.]
MKEFDLEKALAGEPVLLRDGRKAIIFHRIPDEYKYSGEGDVVYKLRGMTFTKEGYINDASESWTLDGVYDLSIDDRPDDIIGMWEEPKISIEDLPKPFKPEENEVYYVISPNHEEPQRYKARCLDHCSIQNGNSFRTKEDTQKWLDFMKSMME